MAQYTLQLDLLGGEKVESILSRLQGLTGALSGGGAGGSVFGSGSGSTSPTQKLAADLERARGSAAGLKKEIQSIGTAASQGFKEAGYGKSTISFLKNLSDAKRQSVLAANPDLQKIWQGFMSGSSSPTAGQEGYRGYGLKDLPALFAKNGPGLPNVGALPWAAMKENAAAQSQGEKQSLAGSRLNIAMKMREARDAAKQQIDASKTNIRMAMQAAKEQEKERQRMDGDAAKQSLAASRLNIMRRKQEAAQAAQSLEDDVTFKKDMSFLLMPLFNPGSMWATLFSARQTFSALNTGTGKSFLASSMGGMGAGAATGLLVAGATAAGMVLKGLATIVSETAKSFGRAGELYTKALTGGMGLQWTSKRSIMSGIIGVSDQELPRYGAQMAYLMPKISQAAKILADTAPALTQVDWQFKILNTDLSAMFAKLANDAAPAILKFMDALDGLVKFLTLNHDKIGGIIKAAIYSNPVTAAMALDSKLLEKIFGSPNADKINSGLGKMPSPQAWMKQLPASTWEHQGLVTFGGGNNYTKDIANNTKEMAKDLKTMTSIFRGHGAGGSWGMSPNVANP